MKQKQNKTMSPSLFDEAPAAKPRATKSPAKSRAKPSAHPSSKPLPSSSSKPPAAADAVLSVSAVNRLASSLLEDKFPAIAVEGEVSGFSAPASGHWYFTLKDKDAQLRCAMFARRNKQQQRASGLLVKDGMQVIVRGKLSIYEGRGDYQLIAESLEDAGAGALQRAFAELKKKLQAEGLFDDEHKQELEEYYEHIGIVTSPTGAALQDMLSVFARRFPMTRLTLISSSVQGREAPAEIVTAINTANRLQRRLGLQALIVGRGGGSPEDLQAFNEEAVARAIFASELPVVSAVGHEVDFTIADFVADCRAATPSAAAELLSPEQEEYLQELEAWLQELSQTIARRLAKASQRLQGLQRLLKRPDRRLQEQAQRLDNLDMRLQRAQGVDLRQRQSRLAGLSRGLQAVSPLQTLARGYSISFDEARRPIRGAAQVRVGSRMLSYVEQGQIISTVEAVDKQRPQHPGE